MYTGRLLVFLLHPLDGLAVGVATSSLIARTRSPALPESMTVPTTEAVAEMDIGVSRSSWL